MSLEDENSTVTTASALSLQMKCSFLLDYNRCQLKLCNKQYIELLTELFFLQHGGNYVDFVQFKKRPSHQLLVHLDQNPILNNGSIKSHLTVDNNNSINNENKTSVVSV